MEKHQKKEIGPSNERLEMIRKNIPYHYYSEFEQTFKRLFGKSPVPNRQRVYLVLQGKVHNYRIIEVLLDMVEQRVKMNEKIDQVLSHAEG